MGAQIRGCLAINFNDTTRVFLYLFVLSPIPGLGKGDWIPTGNQNKLQHVSSPCYKDSFANPNPIPS